MNCEEAHVTTSPENRALLRAIDIYCAVWNEPEEARRRALLHSVWSASVAYTDPTILANGPEELLVHIASVRARRPGATLARTTPLDEHHGHVRFGWHVTQSDGSLLREGIDIAEVDDSGKIRRMLGFFGQLALL
jgi:hypothetical protein